ncbi:MAG: hypothetical protein AAF376_09355 [Pseudomonadota bacterium]
MKRIITIALMAATLTAPLAATAEPLTPTQRAIIHFNMDVDQVLERRNPFGAASRSGTFVSTQSRPDLAQSFARFNAQEDSVDGRRGLRGATIFSNRPAHGADIFARIRAESLEDE